ncbi:MAG: polyprenyl synthetase family protein [Alphaproteobacteria bacterium]
MSSPLQAALAVIADETDALLASLLPDPEQCGDERKLVEAMRYAVLGPGKRFRPFLTVAATAACNGDRIGALHVAAAIEYLHAYSLVHDDLPAMDDDDLRRGRPTVHKAYDEATAILAGDALQAQAFQILAMPAVHPDAEVRLALCLGLAEAVGAKGMCGGQALDLAAGDDDRDMGWIARMQRLKTGALIAFSCEAGALLSNGDRSARAALYSYGLDIGLAFQIADDLLDIEGDEVAVGKRLAKDAEQGKGTLPDVMGVEAARDYAETLVRQSVAKLDRFGPSANLLRDAARFALQRRN